VSVVNLVDDQEPTTFSVLAVFSERPPVTAGMPAFFPPPADDLERAVLATVEIISLGSAGSGCLIDAGGRLLTCLHVVKARDGRPDAAPIVAVSLEAGLPPREMFRARVLAVDEARDLALLEIESGLYGETLPQGLKFPHHTIARGGLRLGEALEVLGYPGTGGLGSKPTITLTHGVVSGFEQRGRGRYVKTDAAIAEGNSGGAVLNARRELAGIPVSLVSAGSGILAYLIPIDQLPADWLGK
jgi:putative serine protease PepD